MLAFLDKFERSFDLLDDIDSLLATMFAAEQANKMLNSLKIARAKLHGLSPISFGIAFLVQRK